jgi:hypothetical protein
MMKLKSELVPDKRAQTTAAFMLPALTCQLVELNDDSDRSTMVIKSRDFSLNDEPVKTVRLQSVIKAEDYASPTKALSTVRTITRTTYNGST